VFASSHRGGVRIGHLFIGHSESLNDISTAVDQLAPSIYTKP
jgi:chemotaxis protein methyltransferase CheR